METIKPWRRNAALFIASQSVTLLGSSVVQMAIIWQVALETSSGLWVTLLTLSATIPQTVLSFFAGVWADRYPRKLMIIVADSGIAAVTLGLALILMYGAGAELLPPLLAVSALRSAGAGIQTPAVSAVIPQLVPKERLMRYNGISSAMMSVVQFASPALAAAILSFGPFHRVLLADVATAIIGILLLLFVRIARAQREDNAPKADFFEDLKAGVSYAAREREVRRPLVIYGVFIFLAVPSGFLTALMIERTFGGDYLFLTVNEMAGFAGMVLGGILIGAWGGFRLRSKTLMLGLTCYGLFSVAIGFAYTFWIFAALMFLYSFFIPVVQASVTTILQERVPEEKQGRVFGLLGAMFSGFMPLGMALFGPLADAVRIQHMVIFAGAVIILLGLFICKELRAAKS